MFKQSSEACPRPFRVFGSRRAQRATVGPLAHRFIAECGVLLVQPAGPLRATDFDMIALAGDPWSEPRGKLRGLVVQTREFPGWENVAGFVRHVHVARGHRDVLGRVALATDVHLPDLKPELADHFIRAERRRFGYYDLGTAIAWSGAFADSRSENSTAARQPAR